MSRVSFDLPRLQIEGDFARRILGPLLRKQNIQAKEVHVPRWLYPGMDPEVRFFKKKPSGIQTKGADVGYFIFDSS